MGAGEGRSRAGRSMRHASRGRAQTTQRALPASGARRPLPPTSTLSQVDDSEMRRMAQAVAAPRSTAGPQRKENSMLKLPRPAFLVVAALLATLALAQGAALQAQLDPYGDPYTVPVDPDPT